MKYKFLCIFTLLFVLSGAVSGQADFFPRIDGWNRAVEEKVYDADNLWDLIDGAADLFLEYSFINLNFARYTDGGGVEVRAEIYKHKNKINAFGIYSQERDAAYKYLQIGGQGYIVQGAVNFFAGNYYIKLSTIQKGEKAQNALLTIAEEFNKKFGIDNDFPSELALLPSKAKIVYSEKYIPQNFLGYSFFKPVVTARYNAAAPFTLFVMEAGSAEDADKTLQELFNAVNKENLMQLSAERFLIKDSQNGLIEAAKSGKYIFGVIGCSDEAERRKYLTDVRLNLQ